MSLYDDYRADCTFSLMESIDRTEREYNMSRSIFSRGYKECRDKLSKNSFYSRSCFNCDYYYQSVGDRVEVCQNPSVLEYDMVFSDNNVYCIKWKQTSSKTDNLLFKKGRSILE